MCGLPTMHLVLISIDVQGRYIARVYSCFISRRTDKGFFACVLNNANTRVEQREIWNKY